MIIRHPARTRFTPLLLLLFLAFASLPCTLARPELPQHAYRYTRAPQAEQHHPSPRDADHADSLSSGPGSSSSHHGYVAHPAGDLVCRPFGVCEPCPDDEKPQEPNKGEVPAWEACGKVVRKEKRDFYEFVTCNLLFLIVAMTILWARTSALAAQQYRQLAARIGIQAGTWRG